MQNTQNTDYLCDLFKSLKNIQNDKWYECLKSTIWLEYFVTFWNGYFGHEKNKNKKWKRL